MISVQEFLIRARLEHRSLQTWIAAGWLVPPQTEPELMFPTSTSRAPSSFTICARTSASTMKASRSSCISSIRCMACAGACRACSMKCTPAADPPTKDDGCWWRPGGCRRRATAHANTSYERIMPNRRTMTIIALAGLMLLFGLGPGQTEDYPSRPVRLIITTPAGSLVDVLGRLFAQELSDRLGQTIVVDNRPGAMTQIGADALNRASPDDYT